MRSRFSRWLVGAATLGIVATAPLVARADVQACMGAFEKGQVARKAGKLREARELFVTCGNPSCPSLIRHDCAQFNAELASELPTVVFGARDKQGRDLFDVTVTMDGEVIAQKLDGKPIPVDPGKRTFRFEVAGLPPKVETPLIKVGERARVINVTFDAGDGDGAPADGGDAVKDGGEKDEEARGHTVLPWIVVGVGAVAVAGGLVVALTAPERPSNCNPVRKTCREAPGHPASQLPADRDQAARADSQPVIGYVVAGVGGALCVIGGLVWHFLEPTGAPKKSETGLRFTPWTTGRAAGFGLGGAF